MNNNENPIEAAPEKIPPKKDVLEIISVIERGCVETRSEFDEKGLYYLEMRSPEIKPGQFYEYTYTRKGKFPGHISSTSTVIHKVFCKDGEYMPAEDSNVADFNDETGEWTINVKKH